MPLLIILSPNGVEENFNTGARTNTVGSFNNRNNPFNDEYIKWLFDNDFMTFQP